jgi:hypothetical protein
MILQSQQKFSNYIIEKFVYEIDKIQKLIDTIEIDSNE